MDKLNNFIIFERVANIGYKCEKVIAYMLITKPETLFSRKKQ